MPVTKKDISIFGDTLKNTLNTWGEQIQYGRDIQNLKRVQNNLSKMKDITTDENGNPRSQQDIARAMLNVTTDINSSIKTPAILQYANQSVADFFKSTLAGYGVESQNKFDIQMSKEENPSLAPAIDKATSPQNVNASMYRFRGPSADKYYAPKLVVVNHRNPDGTTDDKLFDVFESGITQRGVPYNYLVGTKSREKLTPEEQFALENVKIQGAIDVRRTPTTSRNSNYNVSVSQTPVQSSFLDESGKTHNYIFQNGKYLRSDNSKMTDEDFRIIQTGKMMTENATISNSSKESSAIDWMEAAKKYLSNSTTGKDYYISLVTNKNNSPVFEDLPKEMQEGLMSQWGIKPEEGWWNKHGKGIEVPK